MDKQTAIESLCEGKNVSEKRKESLMIAAESGVDEKTLIALRDAIKLSTKSTIILSKIDLQDLSRGRGWCRSVGKGETVWGERTDSGNYRVGPGKWSVGATDGFNRKRATEWIVKHVQVGDQVWTIAN